MIHRKIARDNGVQQTRGKNKVHLSDGPNMKPWISYLQSEGMVRHNYDDDLTEEQYRYKNVHTTPAGTTSLALLLVYEYDTSSYSEVRFHLKS